MCCLLVNVLLLPPPSHSLPYVQGAIELTSTNGQLPSWQLSVIHSEIIFKNKWLKISLWQANKSMRTQNGKSDTKEWSGWGQCPALPTTKGAPILSYVHSKQTAGQMRTNEQRAANASPLVHSHSPVTRPEPPAGPARLEAPAYHGMIPWSARVRSRAPTEPLPPLESEYRRSPPPVEPAQPGPARPGLASSRRRVSTKPSPMSSFSWPPIQAASLIDGTLR